MNPKETALILIGYQNDYFATDGILRPVIEESLKVGRVLENTVHLLDQLKPTDVTMIATPIVFSKDYVELVDPVGILKAIKEAGAFMEGRKGCENIPEISALGARVDIVPGKRGLNAFSSERLNEVLKARKIKNIVLAGAVTSICIDSTGRTAFDQGYNVFVLKDCTSGRSKMEQDFYCESIFPLYAQVMSSAELETALKTPAMS